MVSNIVKPIKSFVLRQGKITKGQVNALQTLLPVYGIKYKNEQITLDQTFKSNHPKVIEIGFGMGNATWEIAQNNPNIDYLGIEVHQPGVGSLLMSIKEHDLINLKIINHDAVEVLQNMINDHSIDGFHIFFPDPWHKKKHHKRRLIQNELVKLLCDKLKPSGYIHIATDWKDYALWSLEILNNNNNLINMSKTNDFIPRPSYRPLTKFENRGLNLGHEVFDLMFTLKK